MNNILDLQRKVHALERRCDRLERALIVSQTKDFHSIAHMCREYEIERLLYKQESEQ